MDRPPDKTLYLKFTTQIIYTLFLSILLFIGWITNLNLREISSFLTPDPSAYIPYSTLLNFIIYPIPTPVLAYYSLLLIASISTLYIVIRLGLYVAIPYLMLSFYIGDYLSPILYSFFILFGDRHLKSLSYTLLVIHEPLYIIPVIMGKKGKWPFKSVLYLGITGFLLFIYQARYISYINQLITNPKILSILFLVILFSLVVFRVYGLYSLTLVISPYASLVQLLDGKSIDVNYNIDRKYIGLVFLIALLFLGLPYLSNKPVINLNGSLDTFLSDSLRDASTVLSLSRDSYLNSLLASQGIYVVEYGDSLAWNWSNREEVKDRLEEALEYAENHGIKYILVDKPEELAYWVSPKHYREYKYPLREPLGRYLIILERVGLVETSEKNFYIKDLDADESISLARNYSRYWSNISIDVNVVNGYIDVIGDDPYEIYIHFDVSNLRGYYLFKLVGLDDYYRSIELYSFDGQLVSLWETSYKRIYNPVMVEIVYDGDGELVFKIEDRNPVRLYLYRLESPELYEVVKNGLKFMIIPKNPNVNIILSDFKNSITLDLRYGEVNTFKAYYLGVDGLWMSLIALVAIPTYLLLTKEEFRFRFNPEAYKIPVVALYLYLLGFPILAYSIHPRLLEISWIGGGAFLIAFSMGIFTIFLDHDYIEIDRVAWAFITVPIIISTSFLTKYFYGDIFDLLGDFWRNQSLYSAIDVLVYGVLGLIAIVILFGWRSIFYHIPFIYLIVTGTSFITDLTRVQNPILQALIDLATYLVDYTMESIGYRIEYVTVPAGNALYVYNEKLLTVVILGWPCTGITGLFIFLSFAAVLNVYFKNGYGYSIPKKVFIMGLIVTYLLNILRIDFILYLDMYYGVDAAELFHSVGYEMVFLVWIAIFYMFIHKRYTKISS